MLFQNHDRVIFIGDSVTDTGRSRPRGEGLGDGVGNGYVRCVDTLLNVLYPEMLFHIINMGTSGDTSRDLLARWETELLDLQPDKVVMSIGFNDVWRQFDSPAVSDAQVLLPEYKDNLKQMLQSLGQRGVPLIMLTPYYIESNQNDWMRMKMDEYRAVFSQLAKESGSTLVDLQEVFDDYLRYRHSSYLSWDRVHPGWVASMLIARALLKAVGADRQF